jgi:type II secretory pathway component PulC
MNYFLPSLFYNYSILLLLFFPHIIFRVIPFLSGIFVIICIKKSSKNNFLSITDAEEINSIYFQSVRGVSQINPESVKNSTMIKDTKKNLFYTIC